MKKILMLLSFISACSPAPKTPTSKDACATMCSVGCDGACDPLCATTLELLTRDRIIDIDLRCITNATSEAQVEACGSVGCDVGY